MPRLPDVTALGERPIPSGRRPIVSDQSGEILAHGIGQFGETIGRIGAQIQERQNRIQYAEARSSLLQADVQTRNALEDDPDYSTYEQRYREAIGKVREDAANKITDRTERALFEQDSALDVERGVASLQGLAHNKEIDVGRAGLDETMTSNRIAALSATDGTTREAFVQATNEAITGAMSRGYIKPHEATNLRQAWTSSYAEGYLAMQSVDTQLKMLANPKGTLLEYIDPAKRVELLDRAQRQRIAEEDHAWNLSQRAQKLMNDAASKDLDHALANGQLTPAWIEQNRNRLSADDYRYAYKALESDSSTDINLYADLRENASLGQDIRTEARKALTDRRISRGDYDRLISEVESERPGWYKRGSAYLQNALKPSDVNPDPAAPQRFANALDDWARWASENPKATEAQANDAYRRISTEYSLIRFNQTTLIGRMPRFLVGDRANPDLDATESATVRAFQAGQIDQAELERQAQILKQWRDAWHPIQQKPAK